MKIFSILAVLLLSTCGSGGDDNGCTIFGRSGTCDFPDRDGCLNSTELCSCTTFMDGSRRYKRWDCEQQCHEEGKAGVCTTFGSGEGSTASCICQ